MCGFVGIIDKKKNEDYTSTINLMLDNIKHRGPDEQKVSIVKESGTYLGFCRLSMIDIKGSVQPAYSFNDDVAIMFNGEIYNYIQLRFDLEQKGYFFNTTGEIEVLLKMYELYGETFVDKLDGMFAICIIDFNQNKTILIRDKYGIKPLYYYENNEFLAFSSELKAMKSVVSREIDSFSVYLYLNFRFIPAPHTIFNNTFKLKPGEYVIFSDTGKKNIQYSKYNNEYTYQPFSFEEYNNIISDSILSTFANSDVPLGMFLSGGIDSGIIATILANKLKIQANAAYSIDYSDKLMSEEIGIANEVASILDIPYKNIVLQDRILDYLNNSVFALDEPFYSTVSMSTMKLSEQASKDVKGVLTGDGSDELIYGYQYIRNAINENSEREIIETYLQGIGWLKYISPSRLLENNAFTKEDIIHTLIDDCKIDNNPKETLRRIEIFKRLPDYHLARVDRLSMAYGLEARVPFLREKYVNYMLTLSADTFIEYDDPKFLIKSAMGDKLPYPLRFIYKKPFTAPVKSWIEDELNEDIINIFNDNKLLEKIGLNRTMVLRILTQYRGNYADISNIWGVYLLLKWCKINLQE